MNETATRQLMANTCPQTKEQKMQRQKARSEIANAKPKGKRQVKASQGNTSYGKMVKQDKPFVKSRIRIQSKSRLQSKADSTRLAQDIC
ncbi:hypothetical protein NIA69_06410 [Gemmiger formicilis]|nr:hypothetical protein [Gemmiger formicilis]